MPHDEFVANQLMLEWGVYPIVVGIAHMGELKDVGRIGLRAFIYFEVPNELDQLYSRMGLTGLNAETTTDVGGESARIEKRGQVPAVIDVQMRQQNRVHFFQIQFQFTNPQKCPRPGID